MWGGGVEELCVCRVLSDGRTTDETSSYTLEGLFEGFWCMFVVCCPLVSSIHTRLQTQPPTSTHCLSVVFIIHDRPFFSLELTHGNS